MKINNFQGAIIDTSGFRITKSLIKTSALQVTSLRNQISSWQSELNGWRDERARIKSHNSHLAIQADDLKREHAQIQEDLQCVIRQNQASINALSQETVGFLG